MKSLSSNGPKLRFAFCSSLSAHVHSISHFLFTCTTACIFAYAISGKLCVCHFCRLGGQPSYGVYSLIIGKLHCQSLAFFTFPSEFSSVVPKLKRYSSVQKAGRAIQPDKSCLNINRSKMCIPSGPRPIMLKILPIMLLSSAQKIVHYAQYYARKY